MISISIEFSKQPNLIIFQTIQNIKHTFKTHFPNIYPNTKNTSPSNHPIPPPSTNPIISRTNTNPAASKHHPYTRAPIYEYLRGFWKTRLDCGAFRTLLNTPFAYGARFVCARSRKLVLSKGTLEWNRIMLFICKKKKLLLSYVNRGT